MWIGFKKIDSFMRWSRFNGVFWTGYINNILNVEADPKESLHQDFTPVATLSFIRWDDDC